MVNSLINNTNQVEACVFSIMTSTFEFFSTKYHRIFNRWVWNYGKKLFKVTIFSIIVINESHSRIQKYKSNQINKSKYIHIKSSRTRKTLFIVFSGGFAPKNLIRKRLCFFYESKLIDSVYQSCFANPIFSYLYHGFVWEFPSRAVQPVCSSCLHSLPVYKDRVILRPARNCDRPQAGARRGEEGGSSAVEFCFAFFLLTCVCECLCVCWEFMCGGGWATLE